MADRRSKLATYQSPPGAQSETTPQSTSLFHFLQDKNPKSPSTWHTPVPLTIKGKQTLSCFAFCSLACHFDLSVHKCFLALQTVLFGATPFCGTIETLCFCFRQSGGNRAGTNSLCFRRACYFLTCLATGAKRPRWIGTQGCERARQG